MLLQEQQAARESLEKQQAEHATVLHKLESQLFRAQSRCQAVEERQQSEADQSRETIRELRMQLQAQQEESQAVTQQLEQQVTEYRLKFDYAQKQLQNR